MVLDAAVLVSRVAASLGRGKIFSYSSFSSPFLSLRHHSPVKKRKEGKIQNSVRA